MPKTDSLEAVVTTRDVDRLRKGADVDQVEDCRDASSAYKCIYLFVEGKKSLI